MTLLPEGTLLLAAVLGGILNSVAGGGGFIVFPALLFTGMPPINANATSTTVLWPGWVASVIGYRKDLNHGNRTLWLTGTSMLGGGLGATLLLNTPQAAFERLVPYLLLLATLLFSLSDRITAWLHAYASRTTRLSWRVWTGVGLIQLAIATYGGYYGGGLGILLLAVLGLMGLENIHRMNALKTLLATCTNGAAVVVFVLAREVMWTQALAMIIGTIIGGYASARYARQLDPRLVRRIVILVGSGMTVYFFVARLH